MFAPANASPFCAAAPACTSKRPPAPTSSKQATGFPLRHSPSTPTTCTLVTREERVARIDRRLDERLEDGLIEEIQGLLASGILSDDLLWYGLEYKFVTQYVLGELSYDEMRILLANAIHQFAKRQMTWFRGMERDGVRIHWTTPTGI